MSLAEAKPEFDLQTSRLGLRAWWLQDLEPMARINGDPNVMRYYPDSLDRDASDAWIDRVMTHYQTHGYCFWAAELLETQSLIGFIGLKYLTMQTEFCPCVEIGWRLHSDYWGQGLAPEGATACLEYAFDRGIAEVYSFTSLQNTPSERVMQKIGMHRVGSFMHPLIPGDHHLAEHHLYLIQSQQHAE